jgi:hypothetical protein
LPTPPLPLVTQRVRGIFFLMAISVPYGAFDGLILLFPTISALRGLSLTCTRHKNHGQSGCQFGKLSEMRIIPNTRRE